MLGAVAGCLPRKAMGSAICLEEVVELGAVVCGVCQRWKRATVPRRGDGRLWGLVESKMSDMVKGIWLRLITARSSAVAGEVS